MQILTAAEMRALDQATFGSLAVPSRLIMENAGRACAELLVEEFPLAEGVSVLCGSGNNGGDGYVIARALKNLGVDVEVAALKAPEELEGDALASAISWQRFPESRTSIIESVGDLELKGIIVDCILGTGVSGPLRGLAAEVIDCINQSGSNVFSVDIPSGLSSDSGTLPPTYVQADITAALAHLKLGHVLFPATEACGQVFVLDIGVMETDVRSLIELDAVLPVVERYFSPQANTHKGKRGHVLVIGGGEGKFGAPKLSGRAALRTGAGLVTLLLPKEAAKQIAPELVELMCDGVDFQSPAEWGYCLEGKAAVVLGPGMEGASKSFLRSFLEQRGQTPLVIDADGLNLLDESLFPLLGADVLLTPHPGEIARLLGKSVPEIQVDRLAAASTLSEKTGAWVLLKGARSVIFGPAGECLINGAATERLATAGSGDVLAGILGAFLARGIPAVDALKTGVYLHGLAGDVSPALPLATDLAEAVSELLTLLLDYELPPASFSRQVLPSTIPYDLLS